MKKIILICLVGLLGPILRAGPTNVVPRVNITPLMVGTNGVPQSTAFTNWLAATITNAPPLAALASNAPGMVLYNLGGGNFAWSNAPAGGGADLASVLVKGNDASGHGITNLVSGGPYGGGIELERDRLGAAAINFLNIDGTGVVSRLYISYAVQKLTIQGVCDPQADDDVDTQGARNAAISTAVGSHFTGDTTVSDGFSTHTYHWSNGALDGID